jgi:hypothetical protein
LQLLYEAIGSRDAQPRSGRRRTGRAHRADSRRRGPAFGPPVTSTPPNGMCTIRGPQPGPPWTRCTATTRPTRPTTRPPEPAPALTRPLARAETARAVGEQPCGMPQHHPTPYKELSVKIHFRIAYRRRHCRLPHQGRGPGRHCHRGWRDLFHQGRVGRPRQDPPDADPGRCPGTA